MNVWKLASAAVLATGIGSAAQAALIYDATTLPWGGAGDFSGSSYGQSFFSPAGGGTLTQVSLLITSDDAGTGSITVYVTPDDGSGYPDFSAPAVIGSILDTDVSAAGTPELISLSTSFSLNPSTSYWILIDPSADSDIAWLAADASIGGGVGIDGTSAFDGSDVFPVADYMLAFQMSVTTERGSATGDVPEPMSLTLFGAGLLGLGAMSGLRRRKAG